METSKTIYLDHNATTPCTPEVVEAMLPFFAQHFGNPASPHRMGRDATAAVEQARERMAPFIGCDADELVFTSGATESNNLVILGVASRAQGRKRIVTSAVEHKSVLAPCEFLETQGFEIIRIPVDRDGVIDMCAAESIIDDDTLLVSVQAANNETGTIQPVAQIASLARDRGALVHSDCAQLLGKVQCSVWELGVDYASFSAHKIYGPKGIGALFVAHGGGRNRLAPVCYGGGQEHAIRPGTLNTVGIVGFGEACRIAHGVLAEEVQRLTGLRDSFEKELRCSLDGVTINGPRHSRLPGTSSLTICGIPADVLIANVPSLCISAGAACTSGTVSASHVLLAMGRVPNEATCTVRVGFGRSNSEAEATLAAHMIARAAIRIRQHQGGIEPETGGMFANDAG